MRRAAETPAAILCAEAVPNARLLPGGRLLYAGPAGDQASLFEDTAFP